MVFFTIPTGILADIILFVFTAGPLYAFGIWTILFVVGVWSIFKKARARMGTETRIQETYKTEIDSLNEQITDIKNKKAQILARIAAETDATAIEKLKEAYKEITTQEDALHARIKDLEQTYKG